MTQVHRNLTYQLLSSSIQMTPWSFLVHSTGYGKDPWLPILDFIQHKELRPIPKDLAKKEGIAWKRKVYTTYLYSDFPYPLKTKDASWPLGIFKFVIDTKALEVLPFKGCSPVQGGCERDTLVRQSSEMDHLKEAIEEYYLDRIKHEQTAYNHSHEIVFKTIPMKFILGIGVYDKDLLQPLAEVFEAANINLPVTLLASRAKDGVSGFEQNINVFKKWKRMKHKKT